MCTRLPMTDLTFSLQADPDPAFAALVWEVFFQERGRGLSLVQHFPWLGRDPQAHYACLRDGQQLVAGLVARRIGTTSTAAIGLVCVRADRRGQGLGRLLLDQSIEALDALGFTALTLWTGKPDVYRRQGFEVDDTSVLHTIQTCPARSTTPIERMTWPSPRDDRGLPPFGLSAACYRSPDAQAIVVTDPRGDAVAQWEGPDESVAALLASVLQTPWRLHALAHDTLPSALAASGAVLHTERNHLQMWRDHPQLGASPRPALRLLDRI